MVQNWWANESEKIDVGCLIVYISIKSALFQWILLKFYWKHGVILLML